LSIGSQWSKCATRRSDDDIIVTFELCSIWKMHIQWRDYLTGYVSLKSLSLMESKADVDHRMGYRWLCLAVKIIGCSRCCKVQVLFRSCSLSSLSVMLSSSFL
jgi:hypothetical protein